VSDILEDTSPQAMARAVEASVVAFYAYFGRMPGAQLHDDADLTWYATGIPAPHFNAVLRTQLAPRLSAAELDTRIAATLDHFTARGLPALWWQMPSTLPADIGTALAARSLAFGGTRPGMGVDLAALPDAEAADAVPGLEIEIVADLPAYERWVDVFAASYGYTPEVATRYFALTSAAPLGPVLPARHYLGRLDGAPVAIATLFVAAGVAGLYHVGTLPEVRGRGVGRALALAPLLDARRLGYRVGVLFSSPMGLNIYRRLGFQTVCELSRYVLERTDRMAGADPADPADPAHRT
jgi:GNAT superfamily N-acetyltransferase